MYGCPGSMTPNMRVMISSLRLLYISGLRNIATVCPICVTKATASFPDNSTLFFVNEVQDSVIGIDILTRFGGWNSGGVSKLVFDVIRFTLFVKLNGSTNNELKCNVSSNVPSLINPVSGAAQPSPIVCNQFKSISVIKTFGKVAASLIRSAFK